MEDPDFTKQNDRDAAASPLAYLPTKLLKQGFNVPPRQATVYRSGEDQLKGPLVLPIYFTLVLPPGTRCSCFLSDCWILSFSSLLGQGALLFRGPNILLDGSKQITLFFGDYGQKPGQMGFLNVISNQVYVNNGAVGFNDILKSEKLRLGLSSLSLDLKAQYSIQSARSRRDGRRLEFTNRQPWKPVLIKAGNFQDTETIFVPYPSSDIKTTQDLSSSNSEKISSIKQVSNVDPKRENLTANNNAISYLDLIHYLQRSPHIDVFLSSETYGGQRIQAKCRPTLTSEEIIRELSSKLWVSLDCLPSSSRFSFVNQLLFRISREV